MIFVNWQLQSTSQIVLFCRKLTPHHAKPPLANSRSGVLSGSVFKGVVAAYTGVAPSHVGAKATYHRDHSKTTVNSCNQWKVGKIV
jgi:hypothetical protein